jgi:linoleoyl-CoA desaturase
MVVKTVIMMLVYLTPFVMLGAGLVGNVWQLFGLYLISGLGMAGIGMGVMHDANHGSYSRNRKVNKILSLTMNLIGANAYVWRFQHNMLHHTYTNIEGADEDIVTPFFLRFSPHDKHHWLHKYQHIYSWFFYGLSTLSWVTAKDFNNLRHFYQEGLIKDKKALQKALLSVSGWKLFYYGFALILPMIMIPLSPWLVLGAFCSMHFMVGVIITMIFQTAHVMPSAQYPLPDENGVVSNDWTLHQLVTTTNYAPNSRVFAWFVGGLNHQVEHHLFPGICHVHYKHIAPIVRQTAEEYGIPYHVQPNFIAALRAHTRMLRNLGRLNTAEDQAIQQGA